MAKQGAPPRSYSPGWLEALDHRTALARDLQSRFNEVCSDLGGREALSYAQRSLIERALWTEFWIAQREKDLARGEEVDIGKWVQANNALLGLYRHLGLERRAKDAPSLNEYINGGRAA